MQRRPRVSCFRAPAPPAKRSTISCLPMCRGHVSTALSDCGWVPRGPAFLRPPILSLNVISPDFSPGYLTETSRLFEIALVLERLDHEGHVRIRQHTAVARDQVDELI